MVTGIGLFGTGVILHQVNNVEGFTAAAKICCIATAGCFAAVGQITEVMIIAAIINFVDIAFTMVKKFMSKKIHSKGKKEKTESAALER